MVASPDIIGAFSEDQVARLTGVSKSQLRYWDKTGFYHPSYCEQNRRVAFARVYTFRDIVALRVLNVLRNQYGVSLPHLREVSNRLSHMDGTERWTGVRLWVLHKRVIWQEPDTAQPQEILSRQYVVPTVVLGAVVDDTRRDVAQLERERDPDARGTIVQSRHVVHNAPVFEGTRIPVAAVRRFIEAGYDTDQILKEYPDLSPEDIEAARAFPLKTTAA
ncbi:MAG: DUF433 domain-containing protein [Gammaproteobacteria bacterium]